MDDGIKLENNKKDIGRFDPRYNVILPCSQDDFGEFVSGLLGKPQTIERSFQGTFEINKEDIVNTYNLIDQRIRQQNEATLIQFSVKIIYDDRSSVLLNSLQDFVSYSEVRPIASVAVHLSWIYLIIFKDKKVPEKQQIEMSFGGDPDDEEEHYIEYGFIKPVRLFFSGNRHIGIRINHTARTWGNDIENLLAGHIHTLLKVESKFKKFICKKADMIGFCVACAIIVISLVVAYVTYINIVNVQLSTLKDFISHKSTTVNVISEKIDYLIQLYYNLIERERISQNTIVYIFISFFVSIFIGAWVAREANNQPRSFILLSRSAEELRAKYIKKRDRQWLRFVGSVIASVLTSVFGNIIYAIIISRK